MPLQIRTKTNSPKGVWWLSRHSSIQLIYYREHDPHNRWVSPSQLTSFCIVLLLEWETAYDFYMQKVSMNFAEWTLQEFFKELCNYCFSVNYHINQWLKLRRSFQNNKQVSAYVHKLKELYNMIGTIDECEKVIKLWYGLRSSIQQGLWQDLPNSETST